MSTKKNLFSEFSLFSKKSQLNLLGEFHKSFDENFEELAEELQEEYFVSFTSAEFEELLCDIFEDKDQLYYSPLGFQFLHLVESFLFLAFLHSDHEEFDILDFWQDTIFNEVFMELYQLKKDEVVVSKELSHILENQILSFYYLHLNMTPLEQKGTLLYPIAYELGDFEQRVYIGNENKYISFNNSDQKLETFPNIPVHYVPPHRKFIEIDFGTKIISKDILEQDFLINSDEMTLTIHPSSTQFVQYNDELSEKIKKAINIIKSSSPDCYLTLSNFTNTIIPISETGIVSYSSQHLPGYSSINCTERDFVDLIDDLVHENGHHYLNHALNLYDLINEDDDLIFYSPWRKSLRPIRGIYHAVFTFFFAAKLFSDLSTSIISGTQNYPFNQQEKEKIFLRFLEESIMLNFCDEYIKWSYQQQKITDVGYDLINIIYNELDSLSENIKTVENALYNLNPNLSSQITALKKELKEKKSNYALN
jgi:hypothetical protein